MAEDALYKFPRTPHLLNLGAVTRDDLLLDATDAAQFLGVPVLIEEKVDGANLGISFSSNGQMRFQKRGHWVTPASEAQYAKLQSWSAEHKQALWVALGTRHVLFGEWLYAKHSIHYTKLPDWFLAFDVFDMEKQSFLSCDKRDQLLKDTGVHIVRALRQGTFTSLQQLQDLLMSSNTVYCMAEHPIEGLVIRRQHDDCISHRAKIVHPGFTQAIEEGGQHWSKRQLVCNVIRPDLWATEDDTYEEAVLPDQLLVEPAPPAAAATSASHAATPPASTIGHTSPMLPPAAGGDPSSTTFAAGTAMHASGHTSAHTADACKLVAKPSRQTPLQPGPSSAAQPNTSMIDDRMRQLHLHTATLPTLPILPPMPPINASIDIVLGVVALHGPAVDQVAACLVDRVPEVLRQKRFARDGAHHHITILSPPDLQALDLQYGLTAMELLERVKEEVSACDWLPCGLGTCSNSNSTAQYITVVWPSAQRMRASLGLNPKDFHITLGFNPTDVHDCAKNLSTLLSPLAGPELKLLYRSMHGQPEVASVILLQEAWAIFGSANSSDAMHTLEMLIDAAYDLAMSVSSNPVTSHNHRQPSSSTQQHSIGCTVALCACYVAKARLAGKYGDVQSCLELAQCACLLDDSIPYAHMLIGKAAFNTEHYSQALSAFETALQLMDRQQLPDVGSHNVFEGLREWMLQAVDVVSIQKGIQSCLKKLNVPTAHAPPVADSCDASAQQHAESTHTCQEMSEDLEDAGSQHTTVPVGPIEPRSRYTVSQVLVDGVLKDVVLPRNTSWVIPGQLMGSSTPKSREQVVAFAHLGIRLVITLTEEEPLPAAWFTNCTARNLFVAVPNYNPPSEAQADLILRETEACIASGGAVLIHCGGGKGRAGTALACFMSKRGLQRLSAEALSEPNPPPAVPPAESVRLLREARPGSIETEHQERFVGTYSKLLWKRASCKPAQSVTAEQSGSSSHSTNSKAGQPAVSMHSSSMHEPGSSSAGAGSSSRLADGHRSTNQQCLDASSRMLNRAAGSSSTQHAGTAGISNSTAAAESALEPSDWTVAADCACLQLPGKYPSTPHLPFSPQVADDDIQLDASAASQWVGTQVIVTEKLDGGNCCLYQGQAYARTHKHPASHPSFGPILSLLAGLAHVIPEHIALFGENMSAVHSIEYAHLESPLYLFAAWDASRQMWLSWEAVRNLADMLGLPTVPVLFSGIFNSLDHMAAMMHQWAQEPSAVDGASSREGFVVRLPGSFGLEVFEQNVAKYVRQGHIQTDGTWRHTWKRANVRMAFYEPVQQDGADAQALVASDFDALPTTMTLTQGANTSSGASTATTFAGPSSSTPSNPPAPHTSPSTGKGPGKAAPKTNKSKGLAMQLPRLLFLVGLPGSGKSTFATALVASGNGWHRVSQDDAGGRRAAETEFTNAMLRGCVPGSNKKLHGPLRVVLDRCNATAADRRQWMDLACIGKNEKGVWCVHFDFPAAECKARVAARTDHPTIPFGHGARIVDSFVKQLELPTKAEGFERVYTVCSLEEFDEVLSIFGASLTG